MPQPKPRVLYLEAPSSPRDEIAAGLARRGFAVELASAHDEVLAALAASRFDVVVVDAALGAGHGLRWLRARPGLVEMVPVVLLCGFDHYRQVHAGYRDGARLCVQRPVRGAVLGAHLRALLAKSPAPSRPVQLGELSFDPTRSVIAGPGGSEVRLPPQERQLFVSLARELGRPVDHDRLSADLWPPSKTPASRNNLQSVVKRLRTLLGTSDWMLRAVHGYGYMMTVEREIGLRTPSVRRR